MLIIQNMKYIILENDCMWSLDLFNYQLCFSKIKSILSYIKLIKNFATLYIYIHKDNNYFTVL